MFFKAKGALAGVGACLFLSMASDASAHHSGAMFDRAKTIEVIGTVIEYQYTNPHPWIRIMSKVEGADKEYDIEGPSVGSMRAVNVTPSTLKPGDKILARVHPMKDGRLGGALVEIQMPGGRIASMERK